MMLQPGPSGSQLTVGAAGSGAPGRGGTGEGKAFGPRGRTADSASGAATNGAATNEPLDGIDFVDGEEKGPVSNEQPLAQPVAAGPTKVGVFSPKLVDLMFGEWF